MSNEGHRERLRDKFLKAGLSAFHEYEILELLLSYCIIRKDTKQLSKNLLKKYDSIYNILNLSIDELQTNSYFTPRVAAFFKLLSELFEKFLLEKNLNKNVVLSNSKDLIKYLNKSIGNKDIEVIKVLFLNSQYELLNEENISFGTIDKSTLYIRELLKKIVDNNAKSIIIAHNHPSGNINPSKADIELTLKIKEVLIYLEASLLDHIIITKDDHFSFLENNLI